MYFDRRFPLCKESTLFRILLGSWRSSHDLVGILLPKELPQETGSGRSILSSRKGEKKEKIEAESVFSWRPGMFTKICRVVKYQATPGVVHKAATKGHITSRSRAPASL